MPMNFYDREELLPFTPKVGDTVTYQSVKGVLTGTVTKVHGDIADVDYGRGSKPEDTAFIWRFREGLNNLHDWPGKNKEFECR